MRSNLNEVFQWVAIGGVLLLVLAVYRQLGLLVVDSRAYLAHSFGPKEGDLVEDRFQKLFPGLNKERPWKLLVFAQQNCTACDSLFVQIREWDRESPAAFHLAIVANGNSEFQAGLSLDFPDAQVVSHSRVMGKETIRAYPFTFLMSPAGIVVAKLVGGNGSELEKIIFGRLGKDESASKVVQV